MALISALPLLGNKVTTQEKSRTRGWFHSKWCHASIVQTLQQSSCYWKDSAEIIVLIEIREEAFWGGASGAPANNNQNIRSPVAFTNPIWHSERWKWDERFLWITRSTPGVISPTEGELTSRRAMHRSARTALHHSTTLHCSTPLCSVIHHSIPLYSVLLCFASPKHWQEKPVSP